MSKKVVLGKPDMTLQDAAKKMHVGDFGLLPIAENDRLVGMLSLGDVARTDPPAEKLEETLSQVSSKINESRSGLHLR